MDTRYETHSRGLHSNYTEMNITKNVMFNIRYGTMKQRSVGTKSD